MKILPYSVSSKNFGGSAILPAKNVNQDNKTDSEEKHKISKRLITAGSILFTSTLGVATFAIARDKRQLSKNLNTIKKDLGDECHNTVNNFIKDFNLSEKVQLTQKVVEKTEECKNKPHKVNSILNEKAEDIRAKANIPKNDYYSEDETPWVAYSYL